MLHVPLSRTGTPQIMASAIVPGPAFETTQSHAAIYSDMLFTKPCGVRLRYRENKKYAAIINIVKPQYVPSHAFETATSSIEDSHSAWYSVHISPPLVDNFRA